MLKGLKSSAGSKAPYKCISWWFSVCGFGESTSSMWDTSERLLAFTTRAEFSSWWFSCALGLLPQLRPQVQPQVRLQLPPPSLSSAHQWKSQWAQTSLSDLQGEPSEHWTPYIGHPKPLREAGSWKKEMVSVQIYCYILYCNKVYKYTVYILYICYINCVFVHV